MKKLTLFAILSAMLIIFVGLTAYAEGDVSLTSAWGYDVPSKSDDFKLGINQSGDIIVAEMSLINQESNHTLYATLSYKKPDGTVETSDIKLINAYKMNPTPCVYFYIDRNYSAYCDMFVTFIDHDTLKPYVESINVNDHFNIEQDKFEANGVITDIDPINQTIEFVPLNKVVDKDGNTIMDYRLGMDVKYLLNSEYVDADDYLMHRVNIIFAANATNYTLVNIADSTGGTTVIGSDSLVNGKASILNYETYVEYYENDDAENSSKIAVDGNIPIYVNGYDISREVGYPMDLYTLFEDTDATLEFVDNTGDGIYDAVVATVYEHGIVDDVIIENERICFVSGDSIRFDSSDPYQSVKMIDENGRKITLGEIKPGDVLAMIVKPDMITINGGRISVPLAKNFSNYGNAVKIIDIGNKTVSGTINMAYNYGDFCIDGVLYKTGTFVDGNYDLVYNENGVAIIGTAGLFYLDINGKIIGFTGKSGEMYGYILQTQYDYSGFEPNWNIMLLTENGIETYAIADKVNFNDVIYKNMTGSESVFVRYGRGEANYFKNNPLGNVVKYKLSDGKIISIETASDTTAINDNSEYIANSMKIGNKLLNENTIVFNISSDDISMCGVETVNNLENGVRYSGFVAGNRNYEWSVFIMTNKIHVTTGGGSGGSGSGGDTVKVDDEIRIVTKTENTVYDNEDALMVSCLRGGTDDNSIIFTADSNIIGAEKYSDLKIGDIITANCDDNNKVTDCTVLAEVTDFGFRVFSGSFENAFGEEFNNNLETGVDYIYGYISDISLIGSYILDITYGDGCIYTVSFDNSANMYTYTAGRRVTITPGEWYGDTVDLPSNEKCSPVFVKMYDGMVTDIYTLNTRVNVVDVTMGSSLRP